jgi:hypothetical protein
MRSRTVYAAVLARETQSAPIFQWFMRGDKIPVNFSCERPENSPQKRRIARSGLCFGPRSGTFTGFPQRFSSSFSVQKTRF